jgi:hypothetical protein
MKKPVLWALAITLSISALAHIFLDRGDYEEPEKKKTPDPVNVEDRFTQATKDQLDRIEYASHGDRSLFNGLAMESEHHREAYWVLTQSYDAVDEEYVKTAWLVTGSKMNPIQAYPAGPTARIHSSESYLRNTEEWKPEMRRVVDSMRAYPLGFTD